ncbi:MAG: fibronectin type III domain-containing protein [Synechococcus sp. SB0675_bin_7]|nr:fibronectin type III domain-containing protein [Synechococcus sp. SB0675_bin_7]MYK07779.1 fibronectin type III domain-containing protein [Synechococcus sp. SB0670_bin_20]
MTLAWAEPTDSRALASVTKYQYWYKVSSASNWGSWIDVADSDGGNDVTDETSFVVTGLTNRTEYSFEVRAVNSAGDGAAASAMATPATATNATVVSLNRVGTGVVTEGGTVEFTVTLSRALTAGKIVDVLLSISGTSVTTADWSLALKTGTSLNTGVTLSDETTITPNVKFSGTAAETATLVLTTTPDANDESSG